MNFLFVFKALYTDIRSQQVPIKTLCTVGHEYTDESQVSSCKGAVTMCHSHIKCCCVKLLSQSVSLLHKVLSR